MDNDIPNNEPNLPPRIPHSSYRMKRYLLVMIGSILGVAMILVLILFIGKRARQSVSEMGKGIPKSAEEVPRTPQDPIPNDSDRDGLTNEEENAAGTSETEFDTDYDGISDIDEIRSWKTDPKKFDTDGDGFGDGVEIIRGFNPNGPGKL